MDMGVHEFRRIEERLRQIAEQQPDHLCVQGLVEGGWQRLSYGAFFQQVDRLSVLLREKGVVPGRRVILLGHNGTSSLVSLFALLSVRATTALIDPDLPGAELFRLVSLVDSDFAVMTNRVYTAVGQSLSLRHKIVVDQSTFLYHSNEKAASVRDDTDYDESIATLLITSGTTGLPKAVMLTHENYLYLIDFYRTLGLGTDQDRIMTVLPLFHVACLITSIFIPMEHGASMIYLDQLDPSNLQKAFVEGKPTLLTTVPRLLGVLEDKIWDQVKLKSPFQKAFFHGFRHLNEVLRRFFSINLGRYLFAPIHARFGGCLKTWMSGGAHLDAEIQRHFYQYGFDVYAAYGLTETTGPIFISRLKKAFRFGSVGPVLPESEACLNTGVDQQTLGSSGEICYRGPALMRGYFREDKATQSVIQENWFHTGDLGYFDRHGNLFLSGRSKDLIVFADGKKAMPEAIEHFYQHIDGVLELAVVGLPIVGRSESMAAAAIVVDESFNPEEVVKTVYQRAATLNSPYRLNRVWVMDRLERSNTLKVKRHVLQEQLKVKMAAEEISNLSQTMRTPREKPALQQKRVDKDQLMSWMAHWILDHNRFLNTPLSYEQNFAELGVDSTQALQFCEDLQQHFGLEVKPVALWSYTNIQQLAAYLLPPEEKGRTEPVQIGKGSSKLPLSFNEPIAIVAAQARFPGHVQGIWNFHQKLLAGYDGIVEIPKDRWDIEKVYDADFLAPGKMNCRWGGFIDGLQDFEGAHFGLKPRMVETMDPQQKIVLTLVDEMLAQAGAPYVDLAGTRTGVFIGVSSNDFLRLLIKRYKPEEITMFMSIGNTYASIAGRVAYHFDWHGPVSIVDTACSSSLVAVHQAVQALRLGECDFAVAGGVNVILDPDMTICLSKARLLSPEGRCKTFDAAADGFVRSEGCGVILMKRLSDVNDAEKVLAVIRGTAVNHDGHSNNFTAPNGLAQIACYQRALDNAGIDPLSVSYLETHGTGTVLGDPIEVDSLQQVYGLERGDDHPLILGAVKSNIGHCEGAAGIAGLLKTVMVLKTRQVPRNLHLKALNPHIHLRSQELLFPQENCSLRAAGPVFAAVSSFGITGTNAHMVLSS